MRGAPRRRLTRPPPAVDLLRNRHPMEDALLTAFEQLLNWIHSDYVADPVEAYMLIGQTLRARATAICNPKPTYLGKVSKSVLAAFQSRR